MPNMVYHQSNRTFGLYSEDFSLIGTRTVTLGASLSLYPAIVTVDGVPPAMNINQSVQIELLDPCSDPVVLYATDQGTAPSVYKYTGTTPRFDKYHIPFYVTPLACDFTYSCAMISGPRLDLCNIVDGTTVASFDTTSGDYYF